MRGDTTYRRSRVIGAARAALAIALFPAGGSAATAQTAPPPPMGSAATRDATAPRTAEARQTAPQQALKALTIDDYALWRSIGSVGISDDGRWATYGYSKRETDDTLFVRNLDTGTEHRIDRASGPEFSPDSRWVAYFVSQPFDEAERLRERNQAVSRKVELLELATGEKRSWENAASFDFAPGEGAALAVRKTQADRDAEHDGTDLILRYLDRGYEELIGSVDEFAFNERGSHLAYTTDTPDQDGNGLFLVHLADGARRALDNGRADYADLIWARFTWTHPEAADRDASTGTAPEQLAVLRGEEREGFTERVNVLLAFRGFEGAAAPSRIELDPEGTDGFPEDWVVSEKGSLEFSRDGARLFLSTRPQSIDVEHHCREVARDRRGGEGEGGSDADDADGPGGAGPGAAQGDPAAGRRGPAGSPHPGDSEGLCPAVPEEVANVDIWHWADPRIQSVQENRANGERNRTYRAVLHLPAGDWRRADPATARFVQLADESMADLELPEAGGRWAVGSDDTPYIHDWKPQQADFFVVDIETGERRPFGTYGRTLGLSPDGEHFLIWWEGQIWSYETGPGELVNLTANAPVSFVNEDDDHTGETPPYGVVGWAEGGRSVILRHRFDLYEQPLDGSPALNLTSGYGTENEIELGLVRFDRDDPWIDLDRPVLLSGFGRWTKKDGYFRLDDGEIAPIVFDDARFGRPMRAEHADRILFTREDFRTYPDYWVSNLDFEDPERLTQANPQQAEYLWGRRILFDYETSDGVRLQGTLAIPDDYVAGERRPMLVHFYEKLSQNLHDYPAPRYASSPMYAGYVSNGYLVMEPDVHFRTRTSHSDMLESVEAAVAKVIELGYADPDAVGLHGHSYSGGGGSYIATRSTIFAAIVAGAAPINLTSEFNQIWPGSGSNNHRYDIYGQGRYGTNPYDDPELYREQSPITHVRTMDTPLLYLHGREDGTVPWEQGLEFYNALRFNEKPVIWLSYPGEGHGLRRYENQKDFQTRMREFFDHHLKGAPAPEWMTEGRSFIEKEQLLDAARAMQGGSGSGSGGRGGGAGGGGG